MTPDAVGGSDLTRRQWRMTLLASLGGGLEYYDFIVYGIFAKDIAAAFFPQSDPIAALSLSLAVFAVGYLARPLGGMVLSHFGDRYGRKTVFVVTVFTMSACTLGMGLVPAYASWGVAATLLLVALRFVQGLCIGGELPGAITFVVETASRRPGLACGIVFCLVNGGVLLAALANLALQSWLPPAVMAEYGWRIAFLIGGLFGLVSFWLRRSLEETPEFLRLQHLAARSPVGEVLRLHRRAVLAGIGIVALTAGFNGILFAHMPAYLIQVLHYPPKTVALAMNLALLAMSASLLLASSFADRVAPRRLMQGSALLLLLGVVPAYQVLARGDANLFLVLPLLTVAVAGANGTFAYLLAGLFPTRVRFSGVALSLNLGFTLLSGLGPLAANALIGATGWTAAPGLIIAAVALVGLVVAGRLADRPATLGAALPVSG
ncbi:MULTISPECIES: MFS transporter [unclassified Methylobacterium]|uniref:MFS transporter n=1 Tax=unclassified Methylobacterium TaxID=2615210 RepID=UPI00035D05AE|nr:MULTISPECIES: MFS transporter [Methylobacterium]WFT80011.1 MFS transporter [Methylobacterium nodulans]